MLGNLVPSTWTRPLWRGRAEASDPLAPIRYDMHRLFDEVWRDFGLPAAEGWSSRLAAPRIDVAEDDKEFLVVAELPGLDENDVDVTFADGTLTIRGKHEQAKETDGKTYYVRERTYGAFQRAIPLMAEVDEDKIEATFKNGVLTITLPKTEQAQSHVRRIPLKH